MRCIRRSSWAAPSPSAIRAGRPKASRCLTSRTCWKRGGARVIREGDDVAILAFGRMVSRAKEAAALLAVRGIDARVVDMRWVKPLDVDEIARAAQTKLVVTVEGGIISGGVGEGVLNELARQGAAVPALTLGIPDTFVPQGSSNQLLHDLGLDAEGIADAVEQRLAR